MPRVLRIITLAILSLSGLWLVQQGSAQVLDLGGDRAPDLDPEFTFASTQAAILLEEIATFDQFADSTSSVERVGMTTRATFRRVAASLLDLAHHEPENGAIAFLHGYTIARNRAALDESVQRLISAVRRRERAGSLTDPTDPLRRAIESLRIFNESYRPLRSVPASDSALDAHVAGTMAPLLEALATAEGEVSRTRWPRPIEATGPEPEPPTLSQLREASNGLELEDTVRATLDEILGFLVAGEALVELQPHTLRYRSLLAHAMGLVRLSEDEAWSNDRMRSTVAEQFGRGIALFRSRATREEGAQHLVDLGLVERLGSRVSVLQAEPQRRIRLDSIRDVLIELTSQLGEDRTAPAARSQIALLSTVVERMIASRQLGSQRLRRELRSTLMKLDRQYEQAEGALLEELHRLLDDPGAMADPAFNSVFNNHRQYLEDTVRLRNLPVWVEAITSIRPAAGRGFEALTARMAEWLLDPARRDLGVMAMDQLEEQLARFEELPFEERLRAGDPDAIAATSGRHSQLLAIIEQSREEWAEAWATGEAASPAARRLRMLHRFTSLIRDLDHWSGLDQNPDQLNPWAGWELPVSTIGSLPADLNGSLGRCLVAMIDGKYEPALRLLDEIERRTLLVRLCGRIGDRLASSEPWPVPDDAVGILSQSVHPPAARAALVARREELAKIIRVVLESGFARTNDQPALAEGLIGHLERLIEELLGAMGEGELTIVDVPGLDGL